MSDFLQTEDRIENLGLELSLFIYLFLLPQNFLCTAEASSFPFEESGICPNDILCLYFQVPFMQIEIPKAGKNYVQFKTSCLFPARLTSNTLTEKL